MKKLIAILCSTLLLAGCATAAPKVDASTLNDYYSQEVSWVNCGDNLSCTKISAPLDYANPGAGSIELAVNRYWAGKGEPLGELLINPGGPGASGYDWVKDSISGLGTDKLKASYAIIGFDPRGVQNSSKIKCLSDSELDDFFYSDDGTELGSAADIAATKLKIAKFIDGCKEKSGDLLGQVDTESAARDMDIIRAVLGQAKLDYLGFSYGTFLGTVYANLFPDKVGKFVLDGAVDPTMNPADESVNQLIGFDSALQAYLRSCVSQASCPFDQDLEQNLLTIKRFLKSLEGNPLKNSDEPNRPVTVWAVETGMMMSLYSESYWQYLDSALKDAFDSGDGTMFQRLADFYNDRDQSGKYLSNINEANTAIGCLDSRDDSSDSAMAAENERMLQASPTLGRYWQYGALLCANWPYPVKRTITDYSAKGAPKIVVVGTTNDPATPYQQAVNLAHKVLSDGYLITYKGEGHTAYGGESKCVDDAVDNFFISGELPSTEPSC
ncbi:MAG: alpha/beta hydrolase [Micrococcales bacterium]